MLQLQNRNQLLAQNYIQGLVLTKSQLGMTKIPISSGPRGDPPQSGVGRNGFLLCSLYF